MSWQDIEEAMQLAIVQASGYGKDSVVWSYQNKGERTMPYVRIHFGGETAIGMDWERLSTDLSRPRGQEIRQAIHGVREVPLTIEVFTAPVLGDQAARRVCERIRTKLWLESIRTRLRKAKVVPFDSTGVEYAPDIPSANFRGRALCTLRCYVPVQDCEEYVGYIANVNVGVFPRNWTGLSGASGFTVSATVG